MVLAGAAGGSLALPCQVTCTLVAQVLCMLVRYATLTEYTLAGSLCGLLAGATSLKRLEANLPGLPLVGHTQPALQVGEHAPIDLLDGATIPDGLECPSCVRVRSATLHTCEGSRDGSQLGPHRGIA